ncbi:hypothetical protein [Parabacteroides sp.]
MRGKRIEAHAADALLDRGLTVNLPAPWLLRKLGKKTFRYGVPFPKGQTLCRMAAIFCRMDLDLKELKAGDLGATLECIARNGKRVSRVIAEGMVGDSLLARILVRPLAWYVRCHMTMKGMAELAQVILLLSSPEAFMNTISSLATMNLMAPTESQPTRKGS